MFLRRCSAAIHARAARAGQPIRPVRACHNRPNCSKVISNEKPSSVTGIPSPSQLWPVVALTLLLALVQLLPADWQDAWRYDRAAVAQGQYWRWLSANFVHLGWGHFLLNVAGLWFVGWLYAGDRGATRWLIGLLLSGGLASLGVHFFTPEIHWMVGLSGALHGLFVLGACGLIISGERLGWGLLLGVLAKLAYEQIAGELPMTSAVVGGSVVTDAHLWGAAGGFLAALLEIPGWRRRGASL